MSEYLPKQKQIGTLEDNQSLQDDSVKETKNKEADQTSIKSKGQKCIDDYELGELLGKGAFGTVNLATDKETGEQVAIKALIKDFI